MNKKIELDADAYDTLEFIAEVYNGIGAGKNFDRYDNPFCLYDGIADFSGNWDLWYNIAQHRWTTIQNDRLVRKVNRAKGKKEAHLNDRITWKQYVKGGNIVRKSE